MGGIWRAWREHRRYERAVNAVAIAYVFGGPGAAIWARERLAADLVSPPRQRP